MEKNYLESIVDSAINEIKRDLVSAITEGQKEKGYINTQTDGTLPMIRAHVEICSTIDELVVKSIRYRVAPFSSLEGRKMWSMRILILR